MAATRIDVAELHRGAGLALREGQRAPAESEGLHAGGRRVPLRCVEPQADADGGAHLVVRPALAHSVDDRRHVLHQERAVGAGHLVDLELRRRRQHEVGIQRRVGERDLVDDREQVVARQTFEDDGLLGARRRRVRALHEEHLDAATLVFGEDAAEAVHVDGAPLGNRGVADDPGAQRARVEAHPAADRVEDAGPGPPELPGQRRKGEDRPRGAAAVAVALLTPPDAQHRRAHGAVELGEAHDVVGGQPAHLGGALGCPCAAGGEVLVGPVDVPLDEGPIEVVARVEQRGNGHRQHAVGARSQGEVQVGLGGQRRAARVDHNDRGAGPLTGAEHRRKVRVGHVRVGAPHDNQLAVPQVVGIGRRHRSVGQGPGFADDRGTDRDVGTGGAELLPHERRQAVGAQLSGRRAVQVRHDRRPAVGGGGRSNTVGHEVERLVPADLGELARALRPDAPQGSGDAVRSVHELG